MIVTKKDRDLIAESLTHHLWVMRLIEDTGVVATLNKAETASADHIDMVKQAQKRLRESTLALSRMLYDGVGTGTLCSMFEIEASVLSAENVFGHVLEYVDGLLARRTAIDELGALYEPEQ